MIRTGNKSDLKDGYFLGRSCTDIIADLAAGVFTLAGISALQISEQVRIGWIESMNDTGLYGLTSAGVWAAQRTTTGEPIWDLTAYNYLLYNEFNTRPKLGPFCRAATTRPTTGAEAVYQIHRYQAVAVTTSGAGAAADQTLLAAVAGYYGCMKILGIISSITEAATTIDFEDEDNTDLAGNLSGGFSLNFTASTINTQLEEAIMSGVNAGKALECDITSHGAGGIIIFYLETWYEKSP